jgi:methionine-rich copper-binding protein CopC
MGVAPTTFTATFEHAMRLTNVVITPRGGDPIAVAIPSSQPATTVSIALPALAPGNYTFAWTASGADNHTMTGRVRYMVH